MIYAELILRALHTHQQIFFFFFFLAKVVSSLENAGYCVYGVQLARFFMQAY